MGNASRFFRRGMTFTVITSFTIFAVFPFYWMILTSFKTDRDLYIRSLKLNPLIFNDVPTFKNFDLLFNNTNYLQFVANSLLIGALVVLITLIAAVPAAYSLARLTGKRGEGLWTAVFMGYLLPPTLLVIPPARVVSGLPLSESPLALRVLY